MKIGEIIRPNQKGQIVIPQTLRKALGIDEHSWLNIVLEQNKLIIAPIRQVSSTAQVAPDVATALSKTRGAWVADSWEETEASRREIELTEAKKRQEEQW